MDSHDGRQSIKRLRGERCRLDLGIECHVHRTFDLMVWGAIAYGSRSHLLIIRDNMTVERYVNNVLRPVVVSYVRTIKEGII